MEKIKLVSIVVPAYKQEKTIATDIRNLIHALAILPFPFEVIVVIDGIVDRTYQEIKKIKNKKLRIYYFKNNQGKGVAVKYGITRAKGDVVGFIDAGMDIDPQGISMLMNHMFWYDADIIVGSKLHPVSQVNYPLARKILSWGYRTLTHVLFGFTVRDTQVGLKLFKRKVAKDVFKRLLVKQYAFDIEILAVAYALGYKRIYEAPIKFFFGNSSISSKGFWRVILHMLWDTGAVFYRLKIIHHYDKVTTYKRKKR